MSDDYNGEREFSSIEEAEEYRRQREAEEKENPKHGVFGPLKTYDDYIGQQSRLMQILFAEGEPSKSASLLHSIAMAALGEQYRQHKTKGRKPDISKELRIKSAALTAAKRHIREYGEIRQRELTGDTISVMEQSGATVHCLTEKP